jgi:hypothetical protein
MSSEIWYKSFPQSLYLRKVCLWNSKVFIRIFKFSFCIFEGQILLLVLHCVQLIKVLSRQQVLLYVSAYWFALLKETELSVIKLSGKQWTDSVNWISTWSARWHSRRFIWTTCEDDLSTGWLSVLAQPSTLFRFTLTASYHHAKKHWESGSLVLSSGIHLGYAYPRG